MLRNLKKAAFDRETVTVGGGEFSPAEVKAFVQTVEQLAALIREAGQLGLTFDIGSAYIRRSYINKQTDLRARIAATLNELEK